MVGLLCVEFFVTRDGKLLVNEIAPRPHNSGHYSIDACDLSQFDLQVRTLAGLPLVQPRQHSPAIMLNLLGDLWLRDGVEVSPSWDQVLALPEGDLVFDPHYPEPAGSVPARSWARPEITASGLFIS